MIPTGFPQCRNDQNQPAVLFQHFPTKTCVVSSRTEHTQAPHPVTVQRFPQAARAVDQTGR